MNKQELPESDLRLPLDLKKLGSTPLNILDHLPEANGVYLALDNASRVWYVGSSNNIKHRLKSHERLDDFYNAEAIKISFMVTDEYKGIESQLINFYDPPLNRTNIDFNPPYVPVDGLTPNQCISRYAEITELMAILKAEQDALKPNIISFIEMNANDGKRYTGEGFRATLTTRKKYEYSEAVTELENKVKQLKKEETENNTAKVVGETVYPVIKRM